MKEKNGLKTASIIAAVALITSTIGYEAGINSANANRAVTTENPASSNESIVMTAEATNTDALPENMIASIIDDGFVAGKEETVYVLANADGTVNKIIVSEWLKNPDKKTNIVDATDLNDIENSKGDETYTINKDNMKVWEANGNDIYYQGTTDKALPVDVSISYMLDGNPISASRLAGKSGRVTIRFDYKNNESQVVLIDGKRETIYVPFVMLTGMIVDDETFTNISVSNGKVINDGDKSVIMGYALPGLQESLGIDRSKLELPDYVEITADVKDFSLATTITFATNDVFNSLNLDNINTLEELQDSLDMLSQSSLKLVNGTSALYDGLQLLLDKSQALVSGVAALYTGTGNVNAGAAQIDAGIGQLSAGVAVLDSGIIELNAGLGQLSGSSEELRLGSKQVFDSLLEAANEQLAAAGLDVPALTIDNYKEVLTGVLGSLDSTAVYNMAYNTALSQVSAAVNEQRPTIRAGVESAVRTQVLKGVISSQLSPYGITTIEEYQAAIAAGTIDEATQAAINAAVDSTVAGDDMQATIEAATNEKVNELINTNMQSADVQSRISAAVAAAEAGAGSIQALIAQLDSYKIYYEGVIAYTSGVDAAYAGSNQIVNGSAAVNAGVQNLSVGMAALVTGTDTLYAGMGTLKTGTDALCEGENQLVEGSKTLSDGMDEFNEKGIQKLVEAIDGDASLVIARVKAIVDVSKDYQTFGGKSDDVIGTVKFIYRTDSIE